jgi:hypothetical protein
MSILRFFFGHGWWILWYLAFHLIMLIGVVMTLAIFAQELKRAGEKPATASPGSFMVFLIGLSLISVTLVNASLWTGLETRWPWYAKAGFSIALATLVGMVIFPLNNSLAIDQSYPSFWGNVAVCVVVVAGNLIMMRAVSD